jgi:hypothetical protein
MHLCDMQVNRISMGSAKCAQSNKTCHQSEIWYLFVLENLARRSCKLVKSFKKNKNSKKKPWVDREL